MRSALFITLRVRRNELFNRKERTMRKSGAQINLLDEIIVDNFPEWAVEIYTMEEFERTVAV